MTPSKLVNKVAEADFPTFDWTGKTSLQELVAVIAGAHLLIGNETSAVHIAAAVGTPSVCITGGGHFGRFVPYVMVYGGTKPVPRVIVEKMDCFICNWHCIYGAKEGNPFPCIERIAVESVFKAVKEILEQN